MLRRLLPFRSKVSSDQTTTYLPPVKPTADGVAEPANRRAVVVVRPKTIL